MPALLAALERRDVELRRQALQVLQTILKRPIAFDPYAPEAMRRQQLGALRESLIEVLRRYANDLRAAGSSLKLVISEKLVFDQVQVSGLADELGAGNVYRSTEWIGETVRRAYADALEEQATR